jgi:hypothetical protein
VNREGTLHIIRKNTQIPEIPRFQVGFADYASSGGAMKTKDFLGEKELRDFFTSIGIQSRIAESALEGLRTEGSASVLNVVLSEKMLISLGLADPTPLPVFPVRFTVFRESSGGPVLSFSPALPFAPATFSSKAGVRFLSEESLIQALDDVGLPGFQIVKGVSTLTTYNVNRAQLSALGFKGSAW